VAGGDHQDAALGAAVGQAEGQAQADQRDRPLAAAEGAEAGGRQPWHGRLPGADVDHLEDALAWAGVAAVAEPEQQQLHAGSEHLGTILGGSGPGGWASGTTSAGSRTAWRG
jgi:hypothetical protein